MSRRIGAILALAFVLALSLVLCWRAALPANRDRGGMDYTVLETDAQSYYVLRNANGYESVVTQVTAHNFARDGFWRTHFLPNRGGAPNVSLYDRTGTQCETLTALGAVPVYENFFSERRPMLSLNGDCIYTHYPPLADWVFGALASLGFDRVLDYKVLAIGLGAAFWLAVYRWLSREVHPAAALCATVLGGTSPAFLQWADTLYYHSFHYLFLICGVLAWTRYLETSQRRWFAVTWVLYLGEALVSYQLTLFFGCIVAGLLVLDRPGIGGRVQLALLSLQACAPAAAFVAHASLIVSLLGFHEARDNLRRTLADRVASGNPAGLRSLLDALREGLLPAIAILAGVALVVVVRSLAGAPLRRPLAVLGVFFAGGVSFMVALPGTTSWHGWMMYRQLMPCVLLLLAFVADSILLAWEGARARWNTMRSTRRALGFGLCAVVGCLFLGSTARHNARRIVGEVELNLAKQRAYDPANLVTRSLDVVYWSEGNPAPKGILYLPVGGVDAGSPPAWRVDFRMGGPGASHYEVWWLDPVEMKTVTVLVDDRQKDAIIARCAVSFFDGKAFSPMPEEVHVDATPFTPARAAQGEPRAWIHFSLPTPIRSRATRFSCRGVDEVALRRIEVFST